MANQLKMAKVHSILTLRSQGRSFRWIARELGVHRETVSRYVHLAEAEAKPPTCDVEGQAGQPARRVRRGRTGQPVRRVDRLVSVRMVVALVYVWWILPGGWTEIFVNAAAGT